jgi:hypothetical protein
MSASFVYPAGPHVRRHGPQGYASYVSYHAWLRDEFSFRCVYCLLREQWARHGALGIDHFLAAAHRAEKVTDYDNLLYACATCNAAKQDRLLPDPLRVLTRPRVHVADDGTIHTEDPEAGRLIEMLGLDSEQSTEFRALWIGIVALAAQHDTELYRKLMGFPGELPNLARLRPPKGNTRRDGLLQCWHARKQSGTLQETY